MSPVVEPVKKIVKWVLRSSLMGRILSGLTALYIWFVFKTSRWTTHGQDIVLTLVQQKKPFIVAFWHNRLLMTCYAWGHWTPFHMLISAHKDGQLIARTVSHFGIHTVVGSKNKETAKDKNKGGAQALRQMCALLKAGETIGITPDGPRGPIFSVAEGIGAVARLAKVPVIPLAYGVQQRVVLSTWDRFIFPWPFNRGKIVWGQPILPPTSQNMAAFLEEVESGLNRVTALADGEISS